MFVDVSNDLSLFYSAMIGVGQKSCFLGRDDQQKRGILFLRRIIERGIITDYERFEKLLHHVLYAEVRQAPEDHPVYFHLSLLFNLSFILLMFLIFLFIC